MYHINFDIHFIESTIYIEYWFHLKLFHVKNSAHDTLHTLYLASAVSWRIFCSISTVTMDDVFPFFELEIT